MNYNKLLQEKLSTYYKPDEINEFKWFSDEETVETYSFVFIDHKGNKKMLTYHKRSKHYSLMPTV